MLGNNSDAKPIRVAALYSGEGAAAKAAISAGIDVVYAYEPVAHTRERYRANTGMAVSGELGPASVMNAPDFDLMMVTLPAAASLVETVFSQALRLVRERRPEAVVIEGPTPRTGADNVALGEVCRNLEDAGYCVCWRPKLGDDLSDSPKSWRTVIIATMRRAVFVWPDEVGYEGEPDAEHGNRRAWERGQPTTLLLALMAAVDMVLRGPVVVDVLVPHFAKE